jgi:hypothetical protein
MRQLASSVGKLTNNATVDVRVVNVDAVASRRRPARASSIRVATREREGYAMRYVTRIQIIAIVIGLAPGACTRQSTDPARAFPAPSTTAPTMEAQSACRFPLKDCLNCNGTHLCARQCPECPPPGPTDLGLPAALALIPAAESCGGTICRPGTHCCNPSCGICTPKGVSCTQQSCN